MTWREYHEETKHTAEKLRRTRHFLDWENMPNPWRHYEGAPLVDLPAAPPAPRATALGVLLGERPALTGARGAEMLSQLLFYSAAVSASKLVPPTGYRYALRVNPSSGNLHPTEFHFATRGLEGWEDGLYHYRPSSHMAERRASGTFAAAGTESLVFVLTSIAWREAWKYRDRAYRYCLHDTGHAWQSLELAARACGMEASARTCFDDDALAEAMRLAPDEWPMCVIGIHAPCGGGSVWSPGVANELSRETVEYPLIGAAHALGKPHVTVPPSRAFGETVRGRRSALDFRGGAETMTLAALRTILACAAFGMRIRLYLYVHRVEGLEPGVYVYRGVELELLRPGDQRLIAAGLSLGQDLAGNACVAFSMAADTSRIRTDREYRDAIIEAGAIGQRLYVAAEALGLAGTGIGAFYDDEVHRYLGLTGEQVVYHFAIGYPVPDDRVEA